MCGCLFIVPRAFIRCVRPKSAAAKVCSCNSARSSQPVQADSGFNSECRTKKIRRSSIAATKLVEMNTHRIPCTFVKQCSPSSESKRQFVAAAATSHGDNANAVEPGGSGESALTDVYGADDGRTHCASQHVFTFSSASCTSDGAMPRSLRAPASYLCMMDACAVIN